VEQIMGLHRLHSTPGNLNSPEFWKVAIAKSSGELTILGAQLISEQVTALACQVSILDCISPIPKKLDLNFITPNDKLK
jgi:hypothetical protein